MRRLLAALVADTRGATLIETAIIAPVLVAMAVGTFETSAMVARQSELQSAAEAAVEIALATVPDTNTELQQVERKIETAAGLSDARVNVKFQYRCASGTIGDTPPTCTEDSLNTYIAIAITDEYQPIWTQWGFAKSFDYSVQRTAQIS